MSVLFKKFKHPIVIVFLACLLSKFQNSLCVSTNLPQNSKKTTTSSSSTSSSFTSSSSSSSTSSSSSSSSVKEPDRAESEARLVQINDVNRYSIQPQNHLLGKWQADEWLKYESSFIFNFTRVQHIEAECQDDYMKIRVNFNGSFTGLLYSTGYAYDPDCVYVNGSGKEYFEFYIQLNRCGTLGQNALNQNNIKNPTNFMWNTITVQYNPLIEEDYDEHFKVTCEYGYDFWKTVTFPFIDVEVATGNPVVFTLSPPECYMEVKNGYDVNGPRVIGPVHVGDPLTLVIYMRSKYDGFDMIVSDCYAHNGAQKRIQLISEDGCPVDDKLISRFRGTWTDSGFYETQIYAYMKTFRFTGSPALYIECDVRMCHGRCPGQTCHWRNLKQLSKRDVENQHLADNKLLSNMNEKPQLEGVNLFQSLRVLEEKDSPSISKMTRYYGPELHHSETCLELSVFSALCTLFLIFISLLAITLLITYMKLREQKTINGV